MPTVAVYGKLQPAEVHAYLVRGLKKRIEIMIKANGGCGRGGLWAG